MSTPPTTEWVGRLRCAIGWREPSRSQLRPLLLVVIISLLFCFLYLTGLAQKSGHLLQTFGLPSLQLAVICMAAGDFIYARVRILAGLLWVASSFIFFPLGLVFSASHLFLQGTAFGFLVAALFGPFTTWPRPYSATLPLCRE